MKVAIVFYGQPRDVEEGFKNINDFMLKNSNVSFDVFYHSWYSNKNNFKFETSKWRNISEKTLTQDSGIIDKINNLYKPIDYIVEEPILFDTSFIKNTLSYPDNPLKQVNLNNTYSQFYSRGKARDILYNYIQKNNKTYDCVITTRFDFYNPIQFNLYDIDIQKINVCSLHFPRKIISDALILMPTNMYLDVFNIQYNFDNILNNTDISDKIKAIGEVLEFNPESLTTGMIYFYNLENYVCFNQKIPYFC